MDLYLDKENLRSLIKAEKDTDSELYAECIRLLKRNLHLVFNFDKEVLRTDPLLSAWCLKRQNCGRGINNEKDEFNPLKFPKRPIKIPFWKNMDWKILTSSYMIEDEKTEALKNTRALLAGGVGEEIELLKQLFCNGSFDLHSIYNIREKKQFPSWKVLKDDGHIMACSDIIIADRYLFGSLDKKKKLFEKTEDNILDTNLYSLLRLFAEEKQSQKVNIVFFTDELPKEYIEKIKNKVESFFGKRNGTNVSFVLYNNDRPHDRFILTNYRLFRSGDSFNNYFDERGVLKSNGLTLDVDSLANYNVYSIVKEIRNWFQKICDNNPNRIFGKRESNFVNLNKLNVN